VKRSVILIVVLEVDKERGAAVQQCNMSAHHRTNPVAQVNPPPNVPSKRTS